MSQIILKAKCECPTLQQVMDHLTSIGWQQTSIQDRIDGPVWRVWTSELGHVIKLPYSEEFIDFNHRIVDAINWLAEIHKTDSYTEWRKISAKD